MPKGKNLQRWKERRERRQEKRAAKKAREGQMRATANAQNAQAVQEWQGLQGATPNVDAQVAANRQIWNQGSREAAVDTSQLQDIANQGYTDADNATLQAISTSSFKSC
jgi:hypothetical protein